MSFTPRGFAQPRYVQASLVSPYDAIVPYGETPIGLKLDITPGWHVYWQNPGDSGMAPQITWLNLDENTSIEIMPWPLPHKIMIPPLASYGYEHQVLIPFNLHLERGTPGTALTLDAQVDWLVCKDICLPESQTLRLTLPLAEVAHEDPSVAALFNQTQKSTPQPSPTGIVAEADSQFIDILLPPNVTQALFIPNVEGVINDAADQVVNQGRLRIELDPRADAPKASLQGLLLTNLGNWRVEAPLTVVTALPQLHTTLPVTTLLLVLVFALLGGLLLNLMPCVLPVLSLKVLGMTKQHTLHHRKTYANYYTLGVVSSFMLLGVTLMLLRAAGESLGWGFQLQSPVFVGGLIMLFVLITLNLLGLFEMVPPTPNAPGAEKGTRRGAFLSGVLAAVVASPCTVPFMGTAVAYAITSGGVASLVVFVALGTGLALPFLLISYIPRLARFIPKPGPWLLWFKKILALPLALTAAWLVWIYLQQVHFTYFWTAAALLAVGLFQGGLLRVAGNLTLPAYKRRGYFVLTALLFAGALYGVQHVPTRQQAEQREQRWESFSEAHVQQLNAEGKDVFVAFSAAWCITCKVNEYMVLHTDATAQFFAQHNIVPLYADWTNRNKEIADVLAKFGSQGVPFYLFYTHDGKVHTLPALLTQQGFEAELLKAQP